MTGATGFLGRNLAEYLLEQGAYVWALVRKESRQRALLSAHPNLMLLEGDMEHILQCEALPACADAFFHFAWGGVNRGEIDDPEVQQRNIEGSLNCLKAAKNMGCQVFMDAGSRVEYGITKDGTMEETMECAPVNAYGKAKLSFWEQAGPLCREWGIHYYHLRFFSVYGPGDHPWSIISTLVQKLPKGQTVSLSACRHRWNFMEIRDAVRAVAELYRCSDAYPPDARIVNVASRDTRVLREFVEEIHKLCGEKGKLEYGTFVQAAEGALSICPVTERLHELTGGDWREEITFKEGILRMLKEEQRTE